MLSGDIPIQSEEHVGTPICLDNYLVKENTQPKEFTAKLWEPPPYMIDSTNCLDNCMVTRGMLSPVDPGEMSDVIECGLEEIAIIPPSTKDSDSTVEVLRYIFFICLGWEGLMLLIALIALIIGMLSPVDPGEMSDVIECGLEEIAIIPPSTKDSDSSVEVFRYSSVLFVWDGRGL